MTIEVQVSHAKQPRNYLELPPLYYIAMDDWLDKLGEKSFCLWLKLYTMVDRTGEEQEHCVKTRTSKLIKKLNMSKPTYLKLIKPLYEYGLVDLVEYEGSKNEGSKPVNIFVHKHPQGKFDLAVQPLEKCRSWEQRTDEKYSFTKDGGRPKGDKQQEQEPAQVEYMPEPPAYEPITPVYEEVPPIEEVPMSVPTPAPTPIEVPKSVPTFNDEVDLVVMTEFEHFKNQMIENNVDLAVVVKWINNNAELIGRNEMCYVLKQLATYPEPIKHTPAFITRTAEKATALHTPVTMPKRQYEEPASYTPKVPFYNWLEERE